MSLTKDQQRLLDIAVESYWNDLESYSSMGKPVPDSFNADTRGHLFALYLLDDSQRSLYEEAQEAFYTKANAGFNFILNKRVSVVEAEMEEQRKRLPFSHLGYYDEDGSWVSNYSLFQSLTPEQVKQYQKFALENDPVKFPYWEVIHPVVRIAWMDRFNLYEDGIKKDG